MRNSATIGDLECSFLLLGDRVGLHEVHAIAPLREHPLHPDPEHSVAVMDRRPLDGPFQNCELVTESDVLERETLTVLYQEAGENDEMTQSGHRAIMPAIRLGSSQAIVYGRFRRVRTAFPSTCEVFGSHTFLDEPDE